MNRRQVTSICLSVLISSAFAYDLHRAKSVSLGLRKSTLPNKNDASRTVEISYRPQRSDEDMILNLLTKATTNRWGIVNAQQKVGLVLDVNNRLAAVFDGVKKTAFVFTTTDDVGGQHLAPDNSGQVWDAAQEDFQSFFGKLDSLSSFMDEKISDTSVFDLADMSKHLIAVDAGVPLFIDTVTKISRLLQGSIQYLNQNEGSAVFRGDIVRFMTLLEGFTELVKHIGNQARVQFDMQAILSAKNSVEALIHSLMSLLEQGALTRVEGLLNDGKQTLKAITAFNPGTPKGVDGVLMIVDSMISFADDGTDIKDVIDEIINFTVLNMHKGPIDFTDELRKFQQLVEMAGPTSDNELKGFTDSVRSLKEGTLTINGVNIAKMIQLLSSGIKNPFVFMVTVARGFGDVFPAEETIAELMTNLIHKIGTEEGKSVLRHLGVRRPVATTRSLLSPIFTIAFNMIKEGMRGAIKQIPIVGPIFEMFENALGIADYYVDLDNVAKSVFDENKDILQSMCPDALGFVFDLV